MSVHKISVKQLVSRVHQVFPGAPENYILNLINDALVESGMYHTKVEYAKTDLVEDQMWYTVNDNSSGQKINKVYRVDIKDTSGEYIRVPRLLDAETLKMDLV